MAKRQQSVVQTIRDIDGGVLCQGEHKSWRGYVEMMVSRGTDLSRADFSAKDLSGLDLPGIKARGARFDGANMRGAQIDKGDFTGASFKPMTPQQVSACTGYQSDEYWYTRMDGCSAEGASFDHSDLSCAVLSGASLRFARIRSARLDSTVLAHTTGSSVDFSHSSGENTDFTEARLINSEFACASLVKPDFRGTNLDTKMFDQREPDVQTRLHPHMPNRTRGAFIVAGLYDKDTVLGSTIPAIRFDSRVGKMTRIGITAASMLGLVAGMHLAGDPATEMASHFIGEHVNSEWGLIGTVGALQLVNHWGGDAVREWASEHMTSIATSVRSLIKELDIRVVRRLQVAFSMIGTQSMVPLSMALAATQPEAKRRGLWAQCRTFFGNMGHVIVCDRKHLALALGTLSMHANNAINLRHDITVVRCHHDEDTHPIQDQPAGQDGPSVPSPGGKAWHSQPCAMRFMRNGRSAAIWSTPGGHATVCYDSRGIFEGCWDNHGTAIPDIASAGLPQEARERIQSVIAMETGLLADHKLASFGYDRTTHMLRDGANGSILVRRRTTRHIENGPLQPAIIDVLNNGIRIHNKKISHDWRPELGGVMPVQSVMTPPVGTNTARYADTGIGSDAHGLKDVQDTPGKPVPAFDEERQDACLMGM